jgi:hypothetical protein
MIESGAYRAVHPIAEENRICIVSSVRPHENGEYRQKGRATLGGSQEAIAIPAIMR